LGKFTQTSGITVAKSKANYPELTIKDLFMGQDVTPLFTVKYGLVSSLPAITLRLRYKREL